MRRVYSSTSPVSTLSRPRSRCRRSWARSRRRSTSAFSSAGAVVAPPGMPSPVLWGNEEIVRERFASGLSRLDLERVLYRFEYPFGPERVVEFFRENYGPTTVAFGKLEGAEREGLRAALVALWREHNESLSPHRTVVEAEYLRVVGTRA